MKILLVEDDPDDLFFARRELERIGHSVVGVEDGAKAIECYGREKPDIVITDIVMPGMDGFALTQEVQRLAAPRWQPVLFLSGHRDDALQIKALQVGADGYIAKPVSAAMLGARLNVIERLLIMQRKLAEHAAELEKYQAAEEEEKRIADHLLRRLVNTEKLDDASIRYWLAAAATFSGDLVAAARTPGNMLHVLLADGTGHGLAASINVLPIIAPFYRMTEKGFGIDAIAREMNAKVKQLLPDDRFVAATLAGIDFREGYIRIWNGGNPAPFMMAPSGEIERRFELRHLPLGILGDAEFEATAETHAFATDTQLILYSDGVIEAENGAGTAFGFDRLAATMSHAGAAERIDMAAAAVTGHMDGCLARDDISIMAVTCDRDGTADKLAQPSHVGRAFSPGNWRFNLCLGATEIRKLDVVPVLLGLANQFEAARDRAGELFVILSELFNNALDHGLLRLDSSLKLGPDGMERYLDEREVRLAALDEGEIELGIEQFELGGRAWLRIACRDTGPGFDHSAAIQGAPVATELPFGRGLALVRSMAASFEFNESGSGVTAILALSAADTHGNPVI